MKRSSIVSVFFILYRTSNNPDLFAQFPPSTNYYFCALNGTCYNEENNHNPKVSLILEEYSQEEIINVTNDFLDAHPEFTYIAPASQLYNCHGFAYSVFQGGEQLKIDWNDALCSYNGCDIESYYQISESSAQKGDIATIVDPNDNGTYSIHSSIVLNNDTVVSKIGFHPVVKHYKYDPWIVAQMGGIGTITQYTYYRRVINTNERITGLSTFNCSGTYTFSPNVTPTNCSWSVEPAAMFQQSSGTGTTANLNYATPFVYLAPKAKITFTFCYGCDNHYCATKEIDLRIPTTTISGTAIPDGFKNALALANQLPERYEMDEVQQADHADYMRLLRLYESLHESGRSIYELTETETEMLESMAGGGKGNSQSLAETLLSEIQGDEATASSCPELPETEGRNRGTYSVMDSKTTDFSVSIWPNPATTDVIVDYILPKNATQATFTITNILGITLKSLTLHGSFGQLTIDLQELPYGIYCYLFSCEGNMKSGKIVIERNK